MLRCFVHNIRCEADLNQDNLGTSFPIVRGSFLGQRREFAVMPEICMRPPGEVLGCQLCYFHRHLRVTKNVTMEGQLAHSMCIRPQFLRAKSDIINEYRRLPFPESEPCSIQLSWLHSVRQGLSQSCLEMLGIKPGTYHGSLSYKPFPTPAIHGECRKASLPLQHVEEFPCAPVSHKFCLCLLPLYIIDF